MVDFRVIAIMVVGVKGLRHLEGVAALVGDVVNSVDCTLVLLADIVPAIEVAGVVEEALSLDRADKGNCQRENIFQGNHFVTKLQSEIELWPKKEVVRGECIATELILSASCSDLPN